MVYQCIFDIAPEFIRVASIRKWNNLTADWLLLIIPGLIWGASFLFMAEGLRSIGPSGVGFVRIAIGFLTLALFPSARKPVARADWPQVAWLGLLWFAFPLSMFPFAEQRVSSALTGMLNGANPLFATIVASYILRRAPSRGVTAGLAVGLIGAVLMAIPAMNEGHSSALGVWMILAALIAYGFALSIARTLQQKYGAIPVIWRAQVIAVILTAPLGIPDLLRAHWSPVPLGCLLGTRRIRNGHRECSDGCGGWQVWRGPRFGHHVSDPSGGAGARSPSPA